MTRSSNNFHATAARPPYRLDSMPTIPAVQQASRPVAMIGQNAA
jgi:hypothetical protein